MLVIHRIFFICTACFLLACSSNDEQATVTATEQTTISEEAPVKTVRGVDHLPLWQSFMQEHLTSFNSDDFDTAYTIPLDSFPPYPANKQDLQFFQPYLAYNADSSRAIDIYSYSSVINKEGNRKVLMSGSPDSQINLVNLKDSTSQRLFFSGPSISFWDAKWIAPGKVIIAGTDERKPVYWVLDLERNNMQLFIMDHVTLDPSLNRQSFLRKKMPGVLIPN